jgi:polysaccharide biosynthesis protein VpsM
MNWPTRAAVAALFLIPAAAIADPLLSFGPDVPLFLTATVSVRHDDNVLLTPTDKVGDTIYLFAPGVDFHYTGGEATAGITFSEQFSRYAHESSLDDQLANLAANIGYQGSQSSFGATGSYVQTDQTTTTATSLDQTVKQTIEAATGNAEVALTAKTRVGVTPSFDRVEFPENGYTDSDIFTLPVDLYYAVTAKTDVSVGYAYNHTTTVNGTGDSKGNFFNVGARGQFTEKLSGQVRVGVTELKPLVGQSTSQLGVESTLSYAYSPKTTFSLYANNGFAPSAAGNQTEVFSTGLSGSFALSNAWSASITGGASQTKYLILPARTDHFYDVALSLNYIVTTNLNLQASYLYRKNVSNIEEVTFDDNLATLTAACRF